MSYWKSHIQQLTPLLFTHICIIEHLFVCDKSNYHQNFILFFYTQKILIQRLDDLLPFLKTFLWWESFLVFIYHNGMFTLELAGTMDPHVTFTVRMTTVLDHLGRCFICLGDMQAQKFLFRPLHKRRKILVCAFDDPVRHGLSRYWYPVSFEFLFYTMECRRIHIFYVQNGCGQGRGHDTVSEQLPRPVSLRNSS